MKRKLKIREGKAKEIKRWSKKYKENIDETLQKKVEEGNLLT